LTNLSAKYHYNGMIIAYNLHIINK